MLNFIVLLTALVATLTAFAMLHDARLQPVEATLRGYFRHAMRLTLLVLILAASAVMILVPSARDGSIYEALLLAALTGHLAMNVPCPWLRYVFKGAPPCERRRSIT